MRIIVIGAVAAGTSAAAKARRNDDFSEIVVYEKDVNISYSGCGLPYYIGNDVENIMELTPRDPEFFKKKYNVDIHTSHEVLKVDEKNKSVLVKNNLTGNTFSDTYDILIYAGGAKAYIPTIPGVEKDHVFSLRNVVNAMAIKKHIITKKPKNVIIAGSGFIGLELLENLANYGLNVTILEIQNKITPNLDYDMSLYLEKKLLKKGIRIIKNNMITEIQENQVLLADGTVLPSEMVIMATGVRPETKLLQEAGVTVGMLGGITVNEKMQTNIPDIYACGDCIETFSIITGKSVYQPLGSTANKTGRIAGDVITGGDLSYKGNLGTSIFRVFDLAIATTGLSEEQAIEEGYDIAVSHNTKPNKPKYFDGEEMVIKTIADKKTKCILGVQIIGGEGVDKRIDIFVTLITYKATVDELFHLDLAYAPPFSTTKDPVHYSGMILDNSINRGRDLIRAEKVMEKSHELQIIDTRSIEDYEKKGYVDGATHIPQERLREMILSLDPNKATVTYCNKGTTGNASQNILLNHGFKEVYNLSGGHSFYKEIKK